nr:hypothetical protein CTI12_AA204890 [Tanacetum cinerariifolium]
MRLTVNFHHDGKQFKLVDGVIYPAFDPKLPWNEMKPTLGLRFEHPEQLKDCLTNYGVANGYQLWYRRNDYRSLFVLCGRDLAEGRSGGKKDKKGDWPYKNEKDEDELPKKYKGKLLRTPKKGWNTGCRKVIGLDGCFLKRTCRGELLTAMGRDGNNKMFPIAWAVGLMEAVKNLLPYAEHMQCAWHIYANFKKKWNGLHFKNLFWGAAISIVQHNFYSKINLFGNIDREAKQWLVDRNPNSWCRAFFKIDRGCAAYENGISESYHNSIRIARVYPCGNNALEVRKGDDSYGVNIDNRTCACKWWDLSGVLYVHYVAAFSFLKNDPILGVSAWYSKKMWQNAYSYFIKPVGGSSMWPQTPEEPLLPPVLRKMPGRPRKLRIEHVTERVNVITISGRMITCHNCWEKGHNKKDPSSAGPSVGDPSSAGPSVAYPSSTGPSVADPSSAGPSVADSTGSGTHTITEDPIVADPTDDILTQQSKTSDTAKIIEDAIATGRLKTAGLKRRCKSERIAKRAKAFQFGKDDDGSCHDKAWDVDDVLAEK